MNLRVGFHDVDLVLKVNWAVTLHLKLLGVGLADEAAAAHVDKFGEELVHARVDHREGMDGDQDLVSLAVDPHRVIVVLVLVDGGRELNVDVLCDASRDHAFLLVLDFEERGLRRQNVQALGRRRVVDQPQLHRVRPVGLESSKFDHAWRRAEDAIRADRVIDKLFGDADAFVCLCLRNDAPRNFNLVLTVWRLTHEALFKLFTLVGQALWCRLFLRVKCIVHASPCIEVSHAGARDAGHGRIVLQLVMLGVNDVRRHFLSTQLSKM